MKIIKQAIVILSLSLPISCTARYTHDVYNVNNASVVTQRKYVSQDEVRKAIHRSGASLGWTMKDIRPGYTVATLYIRTHIAQVGIRYSSKSYSIRLLGTSNLTKRGMIHKNYNGWIHNLNNAIKRNLDAIN